MLDAIEGDTATAADDTRLRRFADLLRPEAHDSAMFFVPGGVLVDPDTDGATLRLLRGDRELPVVLLAEDVELLADLLEAASALARATPDAIRAAGQAGRRLSATLQELPSGEIGVAVGRLTLRPWPDGGVELRIDGEAAEIGPEGLAVAAGVLRSLAERIG